MSNGPMRSRLQRGVATVEFALVAGMFFTLLIGIMEMGRIFFYLNTAAEATRLGARLAAVCDANDADIKDRMGRMLHLLTPERITIAYQPAGCAESADSARSTCRAVSVGINGEIDIDTFIPFVPFSISLPSFRTSLQRESLDSTNNAVCE